MRCWKNMFTFHDVIMVGFVGIWLMDCLAGGDESVAGPSDVSQQNKLQVDVYSFPFILPSLLYLTQISLPCIL